MSKVSAKEYQRLLVEHGVPVELPGVEASLALCERLTAENTANRVVSRDPTVRNAVFFGRFHASGKHYLILPPDRETLEAVRDALYVETRNWGGQVVGAAKALRSLESAAAAAGIQLGPRSIDALSGSMDNYVLTMPQWKPALHGKSKEFPSNYVIHVGLPFDSRHRHVWGTGTTLAMPAIRLKGRGTIVTWDAQADDHRLMRSFQAERCLTCDAEVWIGNTWIGTRMTYAPLVAALDKALEAKGGMHVVSEQDIAEIQGELTDEFGAAALEFERQITSWDDQGRYIEDSMLEDLQAKIARRHGHRIARKAARA